MNAEKAAREGNMTSICVNNAMSAGTTAAARPLTSAVFSQVTTGEFGQIREPIFVIIII